MQSSSLSFFVIYIASVLKSQFTQYYCHSYVLYVSDKIYAELASVFEERSKNGRILFNRKLLPFGTNNWCVVFISSDSMMSYS